MDAKINFGVDYLNVMYFANLKSGGDFNGKAYHLSRMMLCWEWGFTPEEEYEANKILHERGTTKALDDFSVVVERLLNYLRNDEGKKRRFIIDMMMVNLMDGNISQEEKDFTIILANDLDFRQSEIMQMAETADNLIMVLNWYAETWNSGVSD